MKLRNTILLGVAAGALTAGIMTGGGAGQAAVTLTSPAVLQANYDRVISADDGFAVWNPLRGETDWATGDATMIDGTDYSRDWGYPHMVFVAQKGDAFTPLRLYSATVPSHHGWQPVPDSACPPGRVFWAGGLLYAPGARQVVDYGKCVNPADGTGGVSYIATFDAATLAFRGLRAMGGLESVADAVPAPGGWWLPGTRSLGGLRFTADMAWVPAGDQNRPRAWSWTRDVVPDPMLPGNVFSVFRWGSRWLALTEPGDMYGGINFTELAAVAPRGPWTPTGKFWPIPGLSGSIYAYSVVWHGSYLTYAVTRPYGLRFMTVTP